MILSSTEELVVKAKAFTIGANDCLVKLPDKLEWISLCTALSWKGWSSD